MRNDRYEGLDGIKGFALIGIIWYHLSQRSLPGGFIGVDVFFTVSGFLLALSVLREIDRTGRLRLGNFYLRRLSRLWPAMAFMIAGSVSLGLFVNHDILVGVPGKSVSALTFTSNWGEIFSGDSYFAATSPQLLRHLWFVALLAQATLVLPLLTAMLHRIGSTFVQALVPVLLAALSACGMWVLYNPSADPTRVYFGTDTHCFGMLLGVALAFVVRHSEESDAEPRRLFTMVMPWLATGALVVLIMMMPRVGQDASAFRGGLILASVLTVVLIGGSISKDSWMIGLFGWRPLALLGKYSYGMYLWHWPLYLLLQLMLPGYRGSGLWVVQALTLLLSLVMTAVSWWMVENPVAEWIKSKRDKSAPRRPVAQRSAPRRVGSARARGVYGTHLNNVEFTQPYSQAAPLPSSQDAPVVASRSSRTAKTMRMVVTVSVVVLIVIGFFMGVAQAPAKTQTQIMLEKNQSALAKKERQRKMDAKAAAEAKKRAEEERKRREEAKAAIEKTLNGEDVSVIGDSVTVGASAALQKSLPGIAVDAQVSRSILTAPGIVAQMKAEGRLRKYVVISLNTNSATTVGEYERIAAAAGDGHVLVIINAYGDREWIPVANQAASDYVRKHPTDSILVDWNSAIAAHTDWLGPDGIHPQAGQGEDLYASGLRNALAEWEVAHIE